MPARRTPSLSENTRKRIRTTMIVKRLEDHIVADQDLMTTSQVQAARILLNKTLPDLRVMELTGEGGGPIEHTIVLEPHTTENDDANDEG